MVVNNINTLAEDLENQELTAPSGVASPEVYAQLLAIYLYQNDLCNAKFLWKRIPASVKAAAPELGQIWAVGHHLWKRDFPATYQAMNAVKWSENVAEIMQNVQVVVRSRAVDLMSQAYSSINLETVQAMTGLEAETCIAACKEKGWPVESQIVYPRPKAPEPLAQLSSEDQLFKLTDFVSFLEN